MSSRSTGAPRPRGRSARSTALIGVLLVAGLSLGAASGIVRSLAPAGPTTSFAGPLGECREDDRLALNRRPGDWVRTLLDTEYGLTRDDVPGDLVEIADGGIPGSGRLRGLVMDDLAAMAEAARAADAPFRVTSAFRSYDQQIRTLASLEAAFGREEALRAAARPGHSEHQLGTTIDIEGGEAWLAEHAWQHGFVMSYPQAHSPWTTCYQSEPWHFRFVGRETAGLVKESGLSLRAWLWTRQLGAGD